MALESSFVCQTLQPELERLLRVPGKTQRGASEPCSHAILRKVEHLEALWQHIAQGLAGRSNRLHEEYVDDVDRRIVEMEKELKFKQDKILRERALLIREITELREVVMHHQMSRDGESKQNLDCNQLMDITKFDPTDACWEVAEPVIKAEQARIDADLHQHAQVRGVEVDSIRAEIKQVCDKQDAEQQRHDALVAKLMEKLQKERGKHKTWNSAAMGAASVPQQQSQSLEGTDEQANWAFDSAIETAATQPSQQPVAVPKVPISEAFSMFAQAEEAAGARALPVMHAPQQPIRATTKTPPLQLETGAASRTSASSPSQTKDLKPGATRVQAIDGPRAKSKSTSKRGARGKTTSVATTAPMISQGLQRTLDDDGAVARAWGCHFVGQLSLTQYPSKPRKWVSCMKNANEIVQPQVAGSFQEAFRSCDSSNLQSTSVSISCRLHQHVRNA